MKLIDVQKQTATVTSAATITLGAALDKCRTVGQAIAAGDITVGATGVSFFVRDPATGAFESGEYTITNATTLTQTKRTSSSNNGAAVSFSGAACEVYSAAPASALNAMLSAADGVTGAQLTAIASVVKLLAIDSAGNVGVASASAVSSFLSGTTPTPADATSPTAPTNLASNTVTANSFNITFTPGTDNVGVARSEWSLDGTTYTALAAGATSFAVTGRTASTTYQVRVRTVDTSGNVSSPATLSVTTAAASGSADTTAPSMAGSINTSNVTATGFTMSYSAGSDNVGVALYQVSTDGGTTWIDNGTNTSYTKSGATASTPYNLRVRCKDAAGNTSNVLSGSVTTSAAAGSGSPGIAPFTATARAGFPTAIGAGATNFMWHIIEPVQGATQTIVSVEHAVSTSNTVPPTTAISGVTNPKGHWMGAMGIYQAAINWISGSALIDFTGAATNYYFWLKVTDSDGKIWWFCHTDPILIGDGVAGAYTSAPTPTPQVVGA